MTAPLDLDPILDRVDSYVAATKDRDAGWDPGTLLYWADLLVDDIPNLIAEVEQLRADLSDALAARDDAMRQATEAGEPS